MIERFFQPGRLQDLSVALDELDRSSAGDMATVWGEGGRGSGSRWSTLRLPRPAMHPAAPRLWAAAAGVSAAAIFALQRNDAFVDDDGALTLWPWYREEDGLLRPVAEAESAATGLAIPRDFLDEPYDPSHYLDRSGRDALHAFLLARGVTDAGSGFVDRVPVPPRAGFERVTYEGGLPAEPIAEQRFLRLLRWASRAEGLDPPEYEEIYDAVEAVFCQVVAAMGGDATPQVHAPRPVAPPEPQEQTPAVGQAVAVWAVDGGALLETQGRIVKLDERGSFEWAVVARDRIDFATRHGAEAGGHVLDLRSRSWRTGDHGALAAELGLPDVGGVESSYRHEPARSACGLYGLDTDEMPFIQRLSDRVEVASARELERFFGESSNARGLLRPDDLEVGTTMTIDRVRFTLRNDRPSAMEGKSPIAFALARSSAESPGRWRVLHEGTVREGRRVLARIGVAPLGAAFTADGSRLWVLLPDHLARIDLDGPGLDPANVASARKPGRRTQEPSASSRTTTDDFGRTPGRRTEPKARVALLVPLAPILAAAEAT